MTRLALVLTACLGLTLPAAGKAELLTFEDVAPVGAAYNVGPGNPYTEAGFTITPTNILSAVFAADYEFASMTGNTTDWLGFAESNTLTFTLADASGAFDLNSLLLGPSTAGGNEGPITITLTGSRFGGGTITGTFTNLTTATAVPLNWTNLASVAFTTTEDAGLDNIDANPTVPEPSTPAGLFTMCVAGLIGWGCRLRKTSAHRFSDCPTETTHGQVLPVESGTLTWDRTKQAGR